MSRRRRGLRLPASRRAPGELLHGRHVGQRLPGAALRQRHAERQRALGLRAPAATVEGAKDGLFFFGTNGQQANPWGNGTSFQCVVPPVTRAGLLAGTGTLGLCDGSFAQDLNALWCPTLPQAQKNPGAGAAVQAQLWYRDPLSTSNQTTSLSDAVEFYVTP